LYITGNFTVIPSFPRLLRSSPLRHSCQQYPRGYFEGDGGN
jgi:hypothetical protein